MGGASLHIAIFHAVSIRYSPADIRIFDLNTSALKSNFHLTYITKGFARGSGVLELSYPNQGCIMKPVCRRCIALLISLFPVWSIHAATLYVSPTGNDTNDGSSWALAKNTIQAGVDVAGSGDTVLVTNGTYVLTNQVSITNDITVRSANGTNATFVNGNYPITTNRCFHVSTNALLDGFTITNGFTSTYGGGVYNTSGTVQNCAISGNRAYDGGGVYIAGGTVKNCTISGNVSPSYEAEGGGVYIDHGTVQNCTISENSSFTGGGVYNYNGTVQNCTISGNSSGDHGGGVYNYNGTVQNCTISGNTASGNNDGGGVCNAYGTVQNCMISGNLAATGGGVCNFNGTVQSCIISGNIALISVGGAGGGVYLSGGALQNCTISGNTGVWGGGVCSYGGTVQNCTILGNMADDGSGVYNEYSTVQNCIIWNNHGSIEIHVAGGGSFTNCCGASLTNGIGNTRADPLFNDAGMWEGTNFIGGDFHLRFDSPCINMGTNQSWMTNATDILGAPRILGGTVDIGAYEFNPCSASDGAYLDKVAVSCLSISNATGYVVLRNSSNSTAGATEFSADSGTNYDDTTAVAGVTYYYWIRGTGVGVNALSDPNSGYRSLATTPLSPTNVTASRGAYSNKIQVCWNGASGALGYQVWRGSAFDFSTAEILTSNGISATNYDDTSTTPGVRHYYG